MTVYKVLESEGMKIFSAPDYHYVHNKKTGFLARWGTTKEDDPDYCPYGPEILDLEISVNDCNGQCPFCYKGNQSSSGVHMTAIQVDQIMAKMPLTLISVALGLTDLNSNLELIEIMDVIKGYGVTPNFTVNGLNMPVSLMKDCADRVGAISISCYEHLGKDVCYNAVKEWLSFGVTQTNIHLLYHKDNLDFVLSVLNDVAHDDRLKDVNAVVLLALKQKGRCIGMQVADKKYFSTIVAYAFSLGITIGFDSCSAPKFENWAKENDRDDLLQMSERCESGCFSLYVDVNGNVWPCSFCENVEGIDPVNLLDEETNFMHDVWYGPSLTKFRNNLLSNERNCPVYEV